MKRPLYLFCLLLITLVSCKNSSETDSSQDDSKTPSQAFKDEHTSQNSLDWSGVYTGILPCADCEGIETQIELNPNLSYQKITTYLGKSMEPFSSEGNFSWDDTGSTIQLHNEDSPNSYKVVENALIALDMKAEEIEGSLQTKYRLEKN